MTMTLAVEQMQSAGTEDLRRYWEIVIDSLAWQLERRGLSHQQGGN